MGEPYEIGVRHRAAGDHYSDWIDERADEANMLPAGHLDSPQSRKVHRRLMDWFFHERSKQAENRMEMALDADFYDGLQWDPDDAQILSDRGQMPLVFNEVAPMVDWLIGTERRTRVDWRVLPRTEDDVSLADVKTKALKYVSDVNRVPFVRSRAFADSVKVGVGWVDDGARDDPTKDILYSRYEDWRNVLWDSSSYELDLSDARFVFRWRWVDADIAAMMFPARKEQIRRSVIDAGTSTEQQLDADWYLGEPLSSSGTLYASGSGVYGDASRRRIKLIECQFRMPTKVQIIADGPMKGVFFNPTDIALASALEQEPVSMIEKVMMRMHFAVFTESDLIAMAPSFYRHNHFTLTPIWCYRRGKDRLPYGAIRRVRDIQRDMNKRASKALFLFNSNQIIMDKGAVDDTDALREEAQAPDGIIEKAVGKVLEIRRDSEAAAGQVEMMTLDANAIQRTAGVTDENLGRKTNAVSGKAIEARQLQGSVVTTEPFDNLRFATQVQGEKQVALIEQFYTEAKVLRLTGAKGALEWVRINQPEMQADGSVRYLNDVTASQADFIVSEQDYAGTLRQVMFEGIAGMAQKLPPEIAIRLFIIAMEFSDLPNKDEIADAVRKVIGERDPNKPMTPEEAQQMEQQMTAQAEALQMQREMAIAALDEQKAKVAKLNAEAQKILAEAQAAGSVVDPAMEQALRQIQEQATAKLEAMADQLRKVQAEAANKTLAINKDADVKLEAARIDAASRERVAEIQNAAAKQMDGFMGRIEALAQSVGDVAKQAQEANRAAEKAAKTAEQAGKSADDAASQAKEAGKTAEQAAKTAEKVGSEVEKVGQAVKESAAKEPAKAEPAPPPQITVPITLEAGAIQVDARPAGGAKTITLTAGDQKVTGTITTDKEPTK